MNVRVRACLCVCMRMLKSEVSKLTKESKKGSNAWLLSR